ncbi:hypothetical protein KUL25_02520 [Rhodobacteraceae bacterium N5(2021)]|uniref:Uncharacterized protein n=1 Tax=Gymnodinialimonas phycosphaerae TaxID=2841589 RepID=A0A975TW72_9RHOB|nr:hypothetical protein [Gymnodinialimonas phycosphaerae]MBY4891635.1 hypothetical protein [Gymnodinialimonas phycosphaerae]
MSIRKRYDEALLLIEKKHYEAALIIVLVAIAACSVIEGKKKGWTKDLAEKGKPNYKSDRHFFIEYLKDPKRTNIVGTNIVGTSGGTGMADTLYGELRCTLIHEAVVFDDGQGFSDETGIFTYNGGEFRFGVGLLHALLRAIRLDDNLRDQFQDIQHPLERKPAIFDLASIDELLATANATAQAESWYYKDFPNFSESRKSTLLVLMEHIGVEAIIVENWSKYRKFIASNKGALLCLSGNKINGGAIGSLQRTHPQIVDSDEKITAEGWEFLCAMAQHATPSES